MRVIGLPGIPELEEGDDLGRLLAEACARVGGLEDGDVVVVAQKVVSKVEGRVVRLDEVEPSPRAVELAGDEGDPRQVEVILRESTEVVRSRPPLVITRTRHGFVCASAGVDASNAKGPGTVILLPLDPDASAAALRERLRELTGIAPGVIVSDSFGRAWRQGTTDVALGVAGIAALRDLRGSRDCCRLRAPLDDDRRRRRDRRRGRARARARARAFPPRSSVASMQRARASDSDLVMPRERDLFS